MDHSSTKLQLSILAALSAAISVLENLRKDVALSSPVRDVFSENSELLYIFQSPSHRRFVAVYGEQLSHAVSISALVGRAQFYCF